MLHYLYGAVLLPSQPNQLCHSVDATNRFIAALRAHVRHVGLNANCVASCTEPARLRQYIAGQQQSIRPPLT